MTPKPLVLVILDGWGYAPPSAANAISLARKPNYDRLLAEYPNTLIHTSGRYVGLPTGQMGNSEVGHLNIGAGRVVYMDITKIDLMIENGQFFQNPVLLDAMTKARIGERRLHLFGLLSDGGVHSHQNHLYALLRMLKQNGVERVFVHCFMDGRDTLPTNGAGYIEQLQQKMREYGIGKIATVSGRYYAMDRDRRWEREKKAFDALVDGDAEGGRYTDPVQGVKDSYNRDVTDEFIIPFVLTDERGDAVGNIRDGDVCLNFNFRADRARQITRCLGRNSHFTAQDGRELEGADDLDNVIPRSRVPKDLHYVCMTQYDKHFTLPIVSPPESLTNILANVMADRSMRNLRVAETEKYAHVTYFFNGGVEKPFPGEDRVLVPSPKVATYDLKPEMSAQGIADAVDQGGQRKHFRRDGGELRQRRHGRPLRQDSADDHGGRDRRRLCWPALQRVAPARRSADRHCRPRQCRADDRSRDRRPADGAHHESRAVHRRRRARRHRAELQGRRAPLYSAPRWRAAGHRAHHAGHPRRPAAQGNDGSGLEDCGCAGEDIITTETQRHRETKKFMSSV